jgi:DNA-binding phage protein
MTLKDLAEKIGIARESLTRALDGNPTLSTIQGIATALEVNITDLFEQPEQASNFTCPNCGTRLTVSKK